MGTIKKDLILGALPSLKPADLQAIRAACEALLGQKAGKVAPKPNSPQAWLYEALQAVLGTNLNTVSLTGGKQLDKNMPMAVDFFTKSFAPAMKNRTKAVAVMKYVLNLLVVDLKYKKVPILPGTIATNLPRLPEVFDRCFPGYIHSSLTGLILNLMMNGPSKDGPK